jgi:AP-3 complex subunit beta
LVWGLVKGLVDKFLGNGDGSNEMGGVVLRREQVRVVLFEGKAGGGFVDDERAREGGRGALGALSAFGIGPTSSSSVAAKNYQEYDELEDDEVEKGAGGDGGLVLDSFDEDVPEWMERGVESKLRDSEEDSAAARKPVITSMGSSNFNNKVGPSGSGIGGKAASAGPVVLVPTNLAGSSEPEGSEGKKKWKDLEAFYAEEEHEEESGEEEEEEDSEEDEEGEDDDDDDDDDDEEGEEEESAESDSPKAANVPGDEDADDSSEDDVDERRPLTRS